MEFISFIKELRKKGKIYYDVWIYILFELEEKKSYSINRRLDISKTQYYRIISFGIQKWEELIPNMKLDISRGKLSVNIKDTTKKIKTEKHINPNKKEKEVEKIDMNQVYESIISYLNSKANTKYQFTTNSYRTFINARIKSGATLEDFYNVIDNKCNEWMGTDFEKFLRPETLFSNKFETYLNQKINNRTNQEKLYDKVSEATKLGWGSKG